MIIMWIIEEKNILFYLNKVFTGVSKLPTRQKYCNDQTFNSLQVAVGGSFVKKYFDANAKNKVHLYICKIII